MRSIISSVELIGLLDRTLLLDRLEFHIVISCGKMLRHKLEDSQTDVVVSACTKAAHATLSPRVMNLPNVFVSIYGGNAFEWPAIHLLWQLASASPQRKFLYFHNKGARQLLDLRQTDGHQRTLVEMVLFRETVAPFMTYLELFAAYPDISSAGLIQSKFNFPWFNFFWASGLLLSSVREPPEVKDRFHYEIDWLMDLDEHDNATYNMPPQFAVKRQETGYYTPNKEDSTGGRVVGGRHVKGRSYCAKACSFEHIYGQRRLFPEVIHKLTGVMKQDLADFKSSQARFVKKGDYYTPRIL